MEKRGKDRVTIRKGKKPLSAIHPELIGEWDYEKNGPLTPNDVSYGSSKVVGWICSKGHKYDAMIVSRSGGSGCPYCSHNKVLKGVNDLASINPQLASEWDFVKNQGLKNGYGEDISTPDKVSIGSTQKVWWKGVCGHSWPAAVYSRVDGNGCPICSKEIITSFPEQALLYYVSQYYPDCLGGDRQTIGIELDIFIPSERVAYEYDGFRWHSSEEKIQIDKEKNRLCKLNNISLIRIRESGLPDLEDCVCVFRDSDKSSNSLNSVIKKALSFLKRIDSSLIDVEKDRLKISANYLSIAKNNSVAKSAFANEWDEDSNNGLNPEYISVNSNQNYCWKCSLGHTWKATPNDRNSRNRGCPYCAGKKVWPGFNDLQSQKPELLKCWNYEKNINVKPTDITGGSNKKVWWKCDVCGYEWQISPANYHNCKKCGIERRASRLRRKVLCVETGEVFDGPLSASEKIGVHICNIHACCQGKQKTSGGYHWKYIKE